MTDYFALFGEARRPWLDEAELQEKFHQLSAMHHPDTAGNSGVAEPRSFTNVNEAHRVLRDPRLRLEHLLALAGKNPRAFEQTAPAELLDLFWKIGTAYQQIDETLTRTNQAHGALAKAIITPRLLAAQELAGAHLNTLRSLQETMLLRLRDLDARWSSDSSPDYDSLRELHQSLSYVGRWIAQLEERALQIAMQL